MTKYNVAIDEDRGPFYTVFCEVLPSEGEGYEQGNVCSECGSKLCDINITIGPNVEIINSMTQVVLNPKSPVAKKVIQLVKEGWMEDLPELILCDKCLFHSEEAKEEKKEDQVNPEDLYYEPRFRLL